MITTAYPYPVNDKPSTGQAASQPHIYSPSESHSSPRNPMYPHLHTLRSPSPSYFYSGYEQYYPKDTWVPARSAWSSFYPHSPRSSSLPDTAVNPKVTILPSQVVLVSDIDTPSSTTSHSVLTPSSPFPQHDVGAVELQPMDFDEFDCDDEDDFIDSDFADEMEGIDGAGSPLYGASAPHVIKSTSALEGALGDTPSPSYGCILGAFPPADRKLSASVPGYASASHESCAATHQRWSEQAHSPAGATSSSVPEISYPPQHMHTQQNYSSSHLAPTPSSLYNHISSSSLAGAFTSSVPSPHVLRPTSYPLPILQPQPIRPIPPIPLADLASSAEESSSPDPRARASHSLQTLSPLPLLCQPVSDAVRYQLKEPSASCAIDEVCYDNGASESVCGDPITAPESNRFALQGLTLCREHLFTGGTSMKEKLYSSGCMDLPIRWQ